MIDDKGYSDFLEAARVDDPDAVGRVFSVGPYGNRIGFAYQQTRAFILAAAFARHFDRTRGNLSKSDIEMAILGGGVGGITLTAALHSLGFTRLKLFERKSDVLMDQAYATHRLIHPGYNSWPLVDEYASTTRFPFLNWFAGPCDKVVKALRTEWVTEWQGKLQSDTLRYGCLVKSVSKDPTGKRIEVKFRQHPRRNSSTEVFDYVFLTLGFGIETGVALSDVASGRYWNIDTIRQVAEDYEKKKLLCVGDGDGALIDCARLAYRDDVFRVAARLMAKLSSDMQRPPNHLRWDRKKTGEEKAICEAEMAASGPGVSELEGTSSLNEFYRSFVRRLSNDERSILDDSRIRREGFFSGREVHLVGRGASPFRPGAAPINKLIMAHLLETGSVIYHQGEYTAATPKKPATLDTEEACPGIEKFDYIVVRIGTKAPAEQLFENFKTKHKTALRLKVTDYPPGSVRPELYLTNFNLDEREKQRPGTIQNAEKMKSAISKFLRTYCKDANGAAQSAVTWGRYEGGGLVIVDKHEDLSRAASRLGGYDWQLFGIPLVSEDVNRQRSRENPVLDASVQMDGE